MKEKFTQAIHDRKKICIQFDSKEDGRVISRTCAPMDYGSSRRRNVKKNDKYHMWDYDSDKEMHTLSLNPDQIRVEFIINVDTSNV
jgi:hypothetical protein